MAEGRCTLYNTPSVVSKKSQHIRQTFPQRNGANGNILQVHSSEVVSCKWSQKWNTKYVHTNVHRDRITKRLFILPQCHLRMRTTSARTPNIWYRPLAEKRLQLCQLLYMLCNSRIHMHNTCCTMYIHACLHTHIHTHMHKHTRRVFLACVSTQFEYTPKCATHWSFINPFDNVVCEVCSCQSDRGPWNLVVSPLQVSEKGAGGVPEPVDEPSSRAAIVNGVGTCTSYNW